MRRPPLSKHVYHGLVYKRGPSSTWSAGDGVYAANVSVKWYTAFMWRYLHFEITNVFCIQQIYVNNICLYKYIKKLYINISTIIY